MSCPSPLSGSDAWCRALSIEQVAALLKASTPAYGVTRVGSITRLDSIGIATVTAVRGDPIGESVSVSTGKGPTESHALVGALAEALERYCAEPRGRLPVRTDTPGNLAGEIFSPASLIVPRGVTGTGVCDWVRGYDGDGQDIWVPANAVFFPYFPSEGAERLFAANTTGLAVGASVDEALVFGLLECIERDAYSRAVALASVGQGHTIPVVQLELARRIIPFEIDAIRARGHDILIRDVSCDTNVPCYLCTIHDGVLTHMGVAARPDGKEALRAAVQEAAQSRLTDIQGAREDLADRSAGAPVDPWFLVAGQAQAVPVQSGCEAGAAPRDVLLGLQRRLEALRPAVRWGWVDLSLEDVGLATVRAVTPGLEVWAFDPSRAGSRAQGWLCQGG